MRRGPSYAFINYLYFFIVRDMENAQASGLRIEAQQYIYDTRQVALLSYTELIQT
jgi:hypothetical protein